MVGLRFSLQVFARDCVVAWYTPLASDLWVFLDSCDCLFVALDVTFACWACWVVWLG